MSAQQNHSSGVSLFGPVFRWEVVRVSRRGLWHIIRLLFAVALLAYLYAQWGQQELKQNELSLYSEQMASIYYYLQRWAVILLTPLLVCNAILDERQRQTLPLLLSTMLGAREIVLGKMTARLLGLMTILATGLPVLALMQFLGGIDFQEALYQLALAVLIMLFLAMNGICLSARSKTLGSAVMQTYLQTALHFLYGWVITLPLSLPMAFYRRLNFNDVSGCCALFCGLIFAARGVSRLIRSFHDVANTSQLADHQTSTGLQGWTDLSFLVSIVKTMLGVQQDNWEFRFQARSASLQEPEEDVAIRYHRVPDVSDRPLYWKEIYFPMDRRMQWLLTGGSIALGAFAILFVLTAAGTTRDSFSVRGVLRGLLYLVMVLVSAIVGLRAIASLSDEYRQQTIDLLLTWPWSPARLLWEKALGTIRRYRLFLLVVFIIVLPVILATMPGKVFWLLPVFMAQLCLLVCLCMCVAVLFRKRPGWSRGIVVGLVIMSFSVVPFAMKLCWPLVPSVTLPLDAWATARYQQPDSKERRENIKLDEYSKDTATISLNWLHTARVIRNALCPWEAWHDIVHVRYHWLRSPRPVSFATAIQTNSPWWLHAITALVLLGESGLVFLWSIWLLGRRR